MASVDVQQEVRPEKGVLAPEDAPEIDNAPQANVYYNNPNPPLDAGAEQGLAALRDSPPGTKPFYPYSTLIRYAIKGSPGQKMLLEDIYYAMESRFPYFRTAPAGWKNSVRHNLSLNPCFEKVARPLTDRGKGAYWTVNDSVDPRVGVHRERKKKPRKPKATEDDKRTAKESDQSMDLEETDEAVEGGNGVRSTSMEAVDGEAGPSGSGSITRGDADAEGEGEAERDGEGEAEIEAEAEVEEQDGAEAAGGEADEATTSYDQDGNPIPYANWAGYAGSSNYPMAIHYVLDPNEDELPSEIDEDGLPVWRVIWLNELVKLRRVTYHQDIGAADPDWYRVMVERVKGAFLPGQPAYQEGEEEGAEEPGQEDED